MSNANSAAETLDRMVRQNEGLIEARDAFRKIGPLDNAITERENRIKALDEEEQARDRQLKDHRAEMTKDRDAIKASLAKAEADAADMRDRARGEIEAFKKSSTTADREREAKGKEKLAVIEQQCKDRERAAAETEKKAKDAVDAMYEQFKENERLALEQESRLAAARQAIADMMKA